VTCCTYKCEQGRDCPVRKQRIKETNDAYINYQPRVSDPDPAEEVFSSVKALIAWMALTVCVVMVALAFWGML